jgi:hypothetical protein
MSSGTPRTDDPGQRAGVAAVDVVELVALGQEGDLVPVEADDIDGSGREVRVDDVGQSAEVLV